MLQYSFCFLPLFCEASLIATNAEPGVILCGQINNTDKISHGVGSSTVSAPVFSWLLEKSECPVYLGPEISGSIGSSVGIGKAFCQPMLNKNADKVASDSAQNGCGNISSNWLYVFDWHVAMLGFLAGFWLMLEIPRVIVIGKHNVELSGARLRASAAAQG